MQIEQKWEIEGDIMLLFNLDYDTESKWFSMYSNRRVHIFPNKKCIDLNSLYCTLFYFTVFLRDVLI